MRFVSDNVGEWLIVRFDEDVTLFTELENLREFIKEKVGSGTTHIAMSFTPASYLGSRAIAVLVQAFEMLKEKGGRLALIAPSEDMLSVWRTLGLDEEVMCVSTEKSLMEQTA